MRPSQPAKPVLRIDLGREQFVEAMARRASKVLVGGMLVGPDGPTNRAVDDFEDRVVADILVRVKHSRIVFRIRSLFGDVIEEADGDLIGDGVNIAARAEGICEPGAVCLSEDAYRHVRDKLEISFVDLAEKQLKNIVGRSGTEIFRRRRDRGLDLGSVPYRRRRAMQTVPCWKHTTASSRACARRGYRRNERDPQAPRNPRSRHRRLQPVRRRARRGHAGPGRSAATSSIRRLRSIAFTSSGAPVMAKRGAFTFVQVRLSQPSILAAMLAITSHSPFANGLGIRGSDGDDPSSRMVRRNIHPLHGRVLRLGLGPWPGNRAVIELPHGFLNLLFAALVAFAQFKQSKEAATS